MTRIYAKRGEAQTAGEWERRQKKVNSKGKPAKAGESSIPRGTYEKGKRRIAEEKNRAKNAKLLAKKVTTKKNT